MASWVLPPPKVISFDCYGTLVQWREVLLAEIGSVLDRYGAPAIDPSDVLGTYSAHARQLEQQSEFIPYNSILRQGFSAAFAQLGVGASKADVEAVADSVKRMGPHPETVEVLGRLKRRYRLAIFTNSEDELIGHVIRLLRVPIDHVVTAEQARAYKPDRRLFEHAHQVMGVTKDETIHVAMSMTLDVQACHQLGIRSVWVNRLGDAGNPAWQPYVELPDLSGLPGLLGA